MRVAGSVSGLVFFAFSAAVVAVGLLSWRRTQGVRRGGGSSRAPPEPISAPTSRLTWLAAGAGLAAVAWGATVVGSNLAAGSALLVGGAFVMLTGLLARVTHVKADHDGLRIRYAGRQRFDLAWRDLESLHPPRTPLGGWRFQGATGTRTLMPSDLWGKEFIVTLAIARAVLQFDGTHWEMPKPSSILDPCGRSRRKDQGPSL